MHKTDFSLYSTKGRKYLNTDERYRFFVATTCMRRDKKLFCQLLYFTGGRIQEIYNLTPYRIDFTNRMVIIETLKRRKRGIYRAVPIPSFLLDELRLFIKENEKKELWNFSLRTASRYVKETMKQAGIEGIQSSAKALRHGFAVYAISIFSITLVKKILGHSSLASTEVYLNVTGEEERQMVEKLWAFELEYQTKQ